MAVEQIPCQQIRLAFSSPNLIDEITDQVALQLADAWLESLAGLFRMDDRQRRNLRAQIEDHLVQAVAILRSLPEDVLPIAYIEHHALEQRQVEARFLEVRPGQLAARETRFDGCQLDPLPQQPNGTERALEQEVPVVLRRQIHLDAEVLEDIPGYIQERVELVVAVGLDLYDVHAPAQWHVRVHGLHEVVGPEEDELDAGRIGQTIQQRQIVDQVPRVPHERKVLPFVQKACQRSPPGEDLTEVRDDVLSSPS